MEKFTETQIEKYLKWTDANVLPLEELSGRCHICGELLSNVEVPKGPESKVVCLKDRDYFVESYEETIGLDGFK